MFQLISSSVMLKECNEWGASQFYAVCPLWNLGDTISISPKREAGYSAMQLLSPCLSACQWLGHKYGAALFVEYVRGPGFGYLACNLSCGIWSLVWNIHGTHCNKFFIHRSCSVLFPMLFGFCIDECSLTPYNL